MDLVVLVTRGHGEGEGHLRLGETTLASAYAGFGVALAGAVVRGSLAVGVYVGAVDGDDVGLHGPSVQQPAEQLVEDSVVGVLSQSVSEVGEESVAGGVFLEAAGLGGSSVVFKA